MTRTLTNGYTYDVVQNFLGGYSLYYKGAKMENFKRSTTSFRTLAEAEEWFEKQEADYIAWKNRLKTNYNIPEGGYYSITGYYGD